MDDVRVTSVEWATLEGMRPRVAGCNARLGKHGLTVRVPVARITTNDGMQGYGPSMATATQASQALGQSLGELFDDHAGSTQMGMALDFALWDLMAKRANLPVYALTAEMQGHRPPDILRTPCYDTSLYIDDLHLDDDDAAAALIADEARQGIARGHSAFKIKVGRGARHMPLDAGMRRDVAVVRAVRNAVGDDAAIMLDANNGYNLNLTKRVLTETADCVITWIEEPFHEDRELYADLKAWLDAEGLDISIADGEGSASPNLLDWAYEGLVNVVQYDIISYGFTQWLALGKQLDSWNVSSAPHHYGRCYGNYVTGHLASIVDGLAFIEWDEADTPGLDRSEYVIRDGAVTLPRKTGFGIGLDDAIFRQSVAENGYRLTWT